MLDMMKSPPPLFEDVVHKHFAVKEKEVLAQVKEWEKEAVKSKAVPGYEIQNLYEGDEEEEE
jgi:hypothetical protein